MSDQPEMAVLVMENTGSVTRFVRQGNAHFYPDFEVPSEHNPGLGLTRFLASRGVTARMLMDEVPGFFLPDEGTNVDDPTWKTTRGRYPHFALTDEFLWHLAYLVRMTIKLYEWNPFSGGNGPRYSGTFAPQQDK